MILTSNSCNQEAHGVLDAFPPDSQDPILQGAFLDPQLRKGDLLVMHSCCWHQAPPNYSGQDRLGIFNKYSSARAPPPCGPFPFNDAVYNVLEPEVTIICLE